MWYISQIATYISHSTETLINVNNEADILHIEFLDYQLESPVRQITKTVFTPH